MNYLKSLEIDLDYFNRNLGGLLGIHFDVKGWGGITPCLKLVKSMLESWNLVRKYTHICSFRKYTL